MPITWKPITDEWRDSFGWDMPDFHLKDDKGNEGIGSYGYEDENYDGDYWFSWHSEDGVTALGFEPEWYAETE